MKTTFQLLAVATLVSITTGSSASAQNHGGGSILNGVANIIAAANGQHPVHQPTHQGVQSQRPTLQSISQQQLAAFQHSRNQQVANQRPAHQHFVNQRSANQPAANWQPAHQRVTNTQPTFQPFQNQRPVIQQPVFQPNVNHTQLHRSSTSNFAAMIPGRYERRPVTAAHHRGTLVRVGNYYRWTNLNGAGSYLTPDLANGRLVLPSNLPSASMPGGDAFRIDVDQHGAVLGFHFQGAFYTRIGNP